MGQHDDDTLAFYSGDYDEAQGAEEAVARANRKRPKGEPPTACLPKTKKTIDLNGRETPATEAIEKRIERLTERGYTVIVKCDGKLCCVIRKATREETSNVRRTRNRHSSVD